MSLNSSIIPDTPNGLPPLSVPPMPNNNNGANANQLYYPNEQQEQEHQYERMSGDGEEVHRFGYIRPIIQREPETYGPVPRETDETPGLHEPDPPPGPREPEITFRPGHRERESEIYGPREPETFRPVHLEPEIYGPREPETYRPVHREPEIYGPREPEITYRPSHREPEITYRPGHREREPEGYRPSHRAEPEIYRPRHREPEGHRSGHRESDGYRSDRSGYREPESYRSSRHREPDTYGPRDRDQYNNWYPRNMPPRGYMDTSNPSGSFNAPPQSIYPYSVAPTSQQAIFQSCLERFRIESPREYREWYDKYRAAMMYPTRVPQPPLPPQFAPPFAISGNLSFNQLGTLPSSAQRSRSQSGRSSVVNESIGSSGQFRPIQEQPREPSPPKRNTPVKFLSSHSHAMITPLGHMIRVQNGSTVVEIINIKPLMKREPEYKEVKLFPGPLIKDTTHKKTIIQFCQGKIRELEFNDAQVDRDNLILLWELLILLLAQNGMAIGSDVAELLLKPKQAGGPSEKLRTRREVSEKDFDENNEIKKFVNDKVHNSEAVKDEAKCIEHFCEQLIYGHKNEALDYAMDHGLWGHALFFASKMSDRTYKNVLARFANGMALNSPLQTLYQILGGTQPASVTCCCDEDFGDWKPHLAMILSNAGLRPEVEGRAIVTLGDTLGNHNQPFAAQFCYLMAELEFSSESRLGSLLGFNPSKNNIVEATQMTEIYEFARTLGNPEFTLGTSFIQSKFNYTKTLLDLGFVQEAYLYCEELTKSLSKGRIHENEKYLGWNILQIAERLIKCEDSGSTEEPSWIEDLRNITDNAAVSSESTSRKQSYSTSTSDKINEIPSAMDQLSLQNYPNNNAINNISHNGMNQENSPSSAFNAELNPALPSYSEPISQTTNNNQWVQSNHIDSGYEQTQNGFTNPSVNNWNNQNPQSSGPSYEPPLTNFQPNGPVNNSYGPDTSLNNNYLNNQYGNQSSNMGNIQHQPAPSKSMVDSSKTENLYHPRQSENSIPVGQNKKQERKGSSRDEKSNKQLQENKSSWGLSSFFKSFKSKNQMHLPEDKQPAIVWDAQTGQWVNQSGDDEEDSGPKGPPPKDSDLMGGGPPTFQSSNIPPPSHQNPNPQIFSAPSNPAVSLPNNQNSIPNNPPQSQPQLISGSGMMNGANVLSQPIISGGTPNRYQQKKGIGIGKKYVNAWSQQNTVTANPAEPTVPLPGQPSNGGFGQPNIFMPVSTPIGNDSAPTSFLTPMEQSNFISNEGLEHHPPAPQMFNPAQFQNSNNNDFGLNH